MYAIFEEKCFLFIALRYRDRLNLANVLTVLFQKDLKINREATVQIKFAGDANSRTVLKVGRKRIGVAGFMCFMI